MTDFTEMLNEIEEAPRGNARIDACANLFKNSPEIEKFVLLTVDPFVTFGVQKFTLPVIEDHPPFSSDKAWYEHALGLAQGLAARQLTGGEAQRFIQSFRSSCNDTQRKWGDRFLLRDLRLDLGSKAIQKVVGKDKLQLFDVPLATDFEKVKKISGRYVSQPKYDGARVVAFIDADGVVLKSRTGKMWKNFKPVEDDVVAWAKLTNVPLPYVLDGEVVALDENGEIDFQAVQKVLMRGDGKVDTMLQYIVFDGCPLSEWVNPVRSYEARLLLLENIFAELEEECPGHIDLTEYDVIDLNEATAKDELRTLSRQYVERRYEGGIARSATKVVQNKRTTDILKVKAFQDAEATVIGVIEGTGKYKNMLGALQCEWKDGKKFDMGSGFSDAQRAAIYDGVNMGYANFDGQDGSILGCKVTFKFFETTNDGVPRFPIYKSVRAPDDVGNTEEDE